MTGNGFDTPTRPSHVANAAPFGVDVSTLPRIGSAQPYCVQLGQTQLATPGNGAAAFVPGRSIQLRPQCDVNTRPPLPAYATSSSCACVYGTLYVTE